ncbi:hypothetical protein [Ruegeria atlantica]|uniref:hypothetical protein n=1 Tax=Ruegeria atlantica TaxID=81569 RepID=UPI002495840E|nr:hypothetical protein [Ruegeria atlantica]
MATFSITCSESLRYGLRLQHQNNGLDAGSGPSLQVNIGWYRTNAGVDLMVTKLVAD